MQRYLQLFKLLFDANIEYLLCGGMAVNVYGVPRITADIDLILNFSKENLLRFKKVTEQLSYFASVPIGIEAFSSLELRKSLVKEKNMVAYSYHHNQAELMNLDILIKTTFSFDYLWKRKETRKLDESEIFMVSLPDLIAMKKSCNRPQDIQDINFLEKILNADNN